MPLRRHHEKSHHGCAQCRRRRIKCDQERPICNRCIKYGGKCEYRAAPPSLGSFLGTSPKNFQSHSQSERAMSLGVDASPAPSLGSSDVITRPTNLGTADLSSALLRDLELMHHYTAFTCFTISDFASFDHIWQKVVPKEAQSYPFLMYGILGLAALHIGHDQPDVKEIYIAVALRYYNAAIASFRAALKQVTADNSTALFAFSAMLIVLSLGLAQVHLLDQNQNVVEELIQVFTLLQGVRVVLQSATPWVEQGPLAPLLQRGADRQKNMPTHSLLIPIAFDEALSCLEKHNERISQSVQNREMYDTAIQALRDCLQKLASNPGDRAAALTWLVFLEGSYVSSLKSNQPLALVILAHYGVVLHGLREHWFVQAFGVRVIEVIHLNLSEEWKPLVYWPMQQVGLKREPQDALVRTEPG